MNANLFDLISTLDNAAKIPALRAVTHSTMAKCIGSIRQHLREQSRTQRDEETTQPSIDQRNATDENERGVEYINDAMGFDNRVTPLQQAYTLHAVYDWANSELLTLATSKWDAALTLDGMLEFMTSRAQPLDKALISALAAAAKTTEATIKQLHEMQERADREKFIEVLPTVKATFEGFGENGAEESISALPILVQHQLGIKLVEALGKARDNTLTRVMRSRRLVDLANVPLIEQGISVVSKWVEDFETLHEVDFRNAIENGATLRTLDDVK